MSLGLLLSLFLASDVTVGVAGSRTPARIMSVPNSKNLGYRSSITNGVALPGEENTEPGDYYDSDYDYHDNGPEYEPTSPHEGSGYGETEPDEGHEKTSLDEGINTSQFNYLVPKFVSYRRDKMGEVDFRGG